MTAPLTDEELKRSQCTELERRILKTMAGVRNQTLIATLEKRAERPAWVLRLCEHELARREAERAKLEPPPEKPATQIIDLFEALKQSLQEAERAKGGGK